MMQVLLFKILPNILTIITQPTNNVAELTTVFTLLVMFSATQGLSNPT